MNSRTLLGLGVVLATAAFTAESVMAQAGDTLHEAPQRIYEHEEIVLELPRPGREREQRANGRLGRALGSGSNVSFWAYGRWFDLVLAANDRLLARLPRAQRRHLQRSAVVYRGHLDGVDGSWVRLTRQGSKITGMIWDGAEAYMIDSSAAVERSLMSPRRSRAARTLIYRVSDMEMTNAQCALDPSAKPILNYGNYEGLVEHLRAMAPAAEAAAASELDVAVVADTQFVAANGANPQGAVVARMNVVDGIFSEQVGVRLNLVQVKLLSSNGTLTSTSPGTLLTQFGRYADSSALNNPGLAHLFTGRGLAGSTVGIAYLRSLCSSRYGVGVSEIRGTGTVGALVVAHEIGHNFGAPHDNQSGSACTSTPGLYLMNPRLNGSDEFSACSLDQIEPNVAAASCITAVSSQPRADLAPSLTNNPTSGTAGQAFVFSVEVGNSGLAAASGASVRIQLPSAIDVNSAQAQGGSCSGPSGGAVSCQLGTIAAGDDRLVTLSLETSRPGAYTAGITVDADNDVNANNNSATAAIEIASAAGERLFLATFSSDTDGFRYRDNIVHSTINNQGFYASGARVRGGGRDGDGALRVRLGGRDNASIRRMSGGFERSFTLDRPRDVVARVRFLLQQVSHFEPDEASSARMSIDGVLVTNRSDQPGLTRLVGDGGQGPELSSGWLEAEVSLGRLSAGTHVLAVGGYLTKKTWRTETSDAYWDQVEVIAF